VMQGDTVAHDSRLMMSPITELSFEMSINLREKRKQIE
jgi:hypothetical protein